MLRITLAVAVLGLFSALPVTAQDAVARLDTNPDIGVTSNKFLRNYMAFSEDRVTGGASSVFVEIDETIYLVTAKHLLTDAMGLSPEIKPTEFDEALEFWALITNEGFNDLQSADPLAYVTNIIRPDDDFEDDFMILATNGDPDVLGDMTVPISKSVVVEGDGVHVIGCPYSMDASCQQIIYSGEVTAAEDGVFVFSWGDSPPDKLSGFSGGAVLNDEGELVGTVYGGSLSNGVATALPLWLMQFGQ